MPRWETALLPWDLLCSPGRIAWEGDRYINKDHQRMMVDPMFMIVQSLRSFLSAVTPTAVTPTAVAPILVIISKIYVHSCEFT